ncbi:MAG: biotin--[acetyl-CoA-carboxylase] ligase [Cyclobacteriaceae bacterium]|nr:biotin--[acetyl-CoA-carboxylase] ligase [Cyclobacteriaceae bacterium]
MQNYNKSMYKIPANPFFPLRKLIYMPECHSTNVIAEQMVKQNSLPEGSVVLAGYQSAGKGQRGNVWLAGAGLNLTFSLFVKPVWLKASEQMYLTKAFSLGVTDWLQRLTGMSVLIKWPNDILVNNKKICGMLIENQLKNNYIAATIAGIGVNINQREFPFVQATSLAAETDTVYDLAECFFNLMLHIDARYTLLQNKQFSKLQDDYLNNLLGLGDELIFGEGEQQFPGTVLGVDDLGRLEVRTPWGIRFYETKEIPIQWPLK